MVQPVLQHHGLLGSALLAVFLGLRHLQQAVLLGLFGLWHILLQKTKKLARLVLVDGLMELGEGWRHLQALQEDPLLALELDVLGPTHEARKVSLWLDVSTDAVRPRSL